MDESRIKQEKDEIISRRDKVKLRQVKKIYAQFEKMNINKDEVQKGIQEELSRMDGFSDRLKSKMAELELNGRMLSELTGLNYITIGFFMSGKNTNPRLETLIRLSFVLKCSLGWLAYGKE